MQEVRGSNPLISTMNKKDYKRLAISGLPAFFTFGPIFTICLPLGISLGRFTDLSGAHGTGGPGCPPELAPDRH